MDKFEIGMLVEVMCGTFPEVIGHIGEIVGESKEHPGCWYVDGALTLSNGGKLSFRGLTLKPIKPPEINWEELQEIMNWSPEGVTV